MKLACQKHSQVACPHTPRSIGSVWAELLQTLLSSLFEWPQCFHHQCSYCCFHHFPGNSVLVCFQSISFTTVPDRSQKSCNHKPNWGSCVNQTRFGDFVARTTFFIHKLPCFSKVGFRANCLLLDIFGTSDWPLCEWSTVLHVIRQKTTTSRSITFLQTSQKDHRGHPRWKYQRIQQSVLQTELPGETNVDCFWPKPLSLSEIDFFSLLKNYIVLTVLVFCFAERNPIKQVFQSKRNTVKVKTLPVLRDHGSRRGSFRERCSPCSESIMLEIHNSTGLSTKMRIPQWNWWMNGASGKQLSFRLENDSFSVTEDPATPSVARVRLFKSGGHTGDALLQPHSESRREICQSAKTTQRLTQCKAKLLA